MEPGSKKTRPALSFVLPQRLSFKIRSWLDDLPSAYKVGDMGISSLESRLIHATVSSVLSLAVPEELPDSARRLFSLASALEETFTLTCFPPMIHSGLDVENAVIKIFDAISHALSTIAIPLASALECFMDSDNSHLRCVCVLVLTKLISHNPTVFQTDDNLVTIWNLCFSFNTLDTVFSFTPDRIILIQSLGYLAPIYCSEDIELAYKVIESLLVFKNKVFWFFFDELDLYGNCCCERIIVSYHDKHKIQ
jgi:hypothetical protein